MRRVAGVLVVVAVLAGGNANAELGPESPPPGITSSAWKDVWARASKAGNGAAKLVKGTKLECLVAVFLRLLGDVEVGTSEDVVRGITIAKELPVTVHPKGAKRFLQALERERDERCRDDGGSGGANAEAVARYVTEVPEWDVTPLSNLKGARRANASESIEYLLSLPGAVQPRVGREDFLIHLFKAGVLLPAMRRAAAASGVVPIINPCLLDPRLSVCPQPNGT